MKPLGTLPLLLTVCGALGLAGAAQASEKDRLAAEEVLTKHCRACHANAEGKGGLNVFDRDALLARKVINPTAPESSELIELVAAGTMPPGTHRKVSPGDRKKLLAWIAGPAEPPSAYVVRHLLRDWQEQKERPGLRYVSLAHLAAPAHAEYREAVRDDLLRLMKHFTDPKKKGGTAVEPIDAAKLVYRIDLEALGWDRKPFQQRDRLNPDAKVAIAFETSPINLYDLLLLEYPYGSLAFSAPDFPKLRKYLQKAAPLRPVPYLRADWLVGQLSGGKLSEELATLLALGKGKRPQAPSGKQYRDDDVTPALALAEAGWVGDQDKWLAALRGTEAKALAGGESLTRAEWERAYPDVLKKLGEAPIRPLDGLDAPGSLLNAKPARELVTIETYDKKKMAVANTFTVSGPMDVRVNWTQDVVFELLRRSEGAYRVRATLKDTKPPPEAKPKDKKKDVLTKPASFPEGAGEDLGTEQMVVFAMPKTVVEGVKDYPHGLEVAAPEKVRWRYVHPFYRLTDKGDGFAGPPAEEMVAAKATFTIKQGK